MARKKISVAGAGSIGTLLARALSRDPRVLAAYLFGSRANGNARRDSDADVALLLSPRHAQSAFKIQLEYGSKLADLVGRTVDVVILNTADPFLRFQVYSKGKPLFIRDRRKAEEFQVYSLNCYWDYLPLKQTIDRAAARRMARGR